MTATDVYDDVMRTLHEMDAFAKAHGLSDVREGIKDARKKALSEFVGQQRPKVQVKNPPAPGIA
jgi:hypothetical protein